jgi:hypothetical protein
MRLKTSWSGLFLPLIMHLSETVKVFFCSNFAGDFFGESFDYEF